MDRSENIPKSSVQNNEISSTSIFNSFSFISSNISINSNFEQESDTLYTSSTKNHILSSNKYCSFEVSTDIGLRDSQEDRIILAPRLFHDSLSLCAVFDGTVGHYASEFLSRSFVKELLAVDEMNHLKAFIDDPEAPQVPQQRHEQLAPIIRSVLQKSFYYTDAALLRMCDEQQLHYASSTGVVALLWESMLTIAHVGDSKACIARVSGPLDAQQVHAEWLTVDHKPNMPFERKRIESNGGSLVWLHGSKAYIRGGDFVVRQARGEHPKQLNYSRAFGGKDLKMFGLSCEPDISHFEILPDDKLVLLASDGLWDVIDPTLACQIALNARRQGKSATQELTDRAIRDMPMKGVSDNVSVIAMFF